MESQKMSTNISDLEDENVIEQKPANKITMEITKKEEKKEEDVQSTSFIHEINEENVLLILLFFIFSNSMILNNIKKLNIIPSSNEFVYNFILSGVFIIIFIILKKFLLPRITLI